MSKFLLFVVSLPFLITSCAVDQSEEIAQLREEVAVLQAMVGPPPASLDSLYPPSAPAPVFLLRMLQLGEAFSAVAVDVLEHDMEQARAGVERFRTEYADVARMVPEWQAAYPRAPVDSLVTAIESGDPAGLGAALEGVSAVCHGCHVTSMANVHFRYRWGDFGRINATDPESQRVLTYKQLMQEMETAYIGIGTDLRQQQLENARAQYATFRARIGILANTCVACHATERKYFTDSGVQQMVQRLGAAMQSDTPNEDQVADLARQIGTESCGKCHLVHAPAALAKALWYGR